ncbi:MAG: hypothetical protein ACP5OX_01725 [Minisyncoccia bacterium]
MEKKFKKLQLLKEILKDSNWKEKLAEITNNVYVVSNVQKHILMRDIELLENEQELEELKEPHELIKIGCRKYLNSYSLFIFQKILF